MPKISHIMLWHIGHLLRNFLRNHPNAERMLEICLPTSQPENTDIGRSERYFEYVNEERGESNANQTCTVAHVCRKRTAMPGLSMKC